MHWVHFSSQGNARSRGILNLGRSQPPDSNLEGFSYMATCQKLFFLIPCKFPTDTNEVVKKYQGLFRITVCSKKSGCDISHPLFLEQTIVVLAL